MQDTQFFNFGTPSCPAGGTAQKGLAVSRVSGVPTADEFWQHNYDACSGAGNGLEELARGKNFGSTGWVDKKQYLFTFLFTTTALKVFVDDEPEIDIPGRFNDGRIAFYNFSQAEVTYSGFTFEPGVLIDIKPGSDPNSINCNNAKEVITVAILSTASFNALDVDHTTVRFEGASEKIHFDKKALVPRRHEEDVNGDGDTDLVFHFRRGDTYLTCASTAGTLSGTPPGGPYILGVDAVRIVGGG